MSSGLTHNGAIARGLAYAPGPAARAAGRVDEARVAAMRPADAFRTIDQTRAKLRDKVMAERGVNGMNLFLAQPQERIRAELAVRVETALRGLETEARQRAYVRATGNFVDLRV